MRTLDLTPYNPQNIGEESDVLCRIVGSCWITSSKGNACLAVDMEDDRGRKARHHISTGSTGARRILASFSAACGLREDQVKAFDPGMLKGCSIVIDFERNNDGFIFAKRWRKPGPKRSKLESDTTNETVS